MKKTPEEPSKDFEKAFEKLLEIVHELEEGQIGLSESLQKYESGIGLLRKCHGMLQQAERRIELLTEVREDGTVVAEAFEDPAASEAADTKPQRSKRRTARKKSENSAKSTDDVQDSETMDESGHLF